MTANQAEDSAQPSGGSVSACCEGERCFCGAPASAKVEEAIVFDDWSMSDDPAVNPNLPFKGRHPLTSYVCADHFGQIMRCKPYVSEVLRRADLPIPVDRDWPDDAKRVIANLRSRAHAARDGSMSPTAELCAEAADLLEKLVQ